jgi:phosphohistidine phosphatase
LYRVLFKSGGMNLYFVRHGSAGTPQPHPQRDTARRLDREGGRQSELIGRLLAALDVRFDQVLSSPLRRASASAAIIAKRTGYQNRIRLVPALRLDGSYERFQEVLSRLGNKHTVLLVGHNAKLAEFIGKLIGNTRGNARVHLIKGGIAKISTRRTGVAILEWCLTPGLLRAYLSERAGEPAPARDFK